MASENQKRTITRGPQLRWERDMKLVVNLLTTDFDLDGKKRADIFNSMFNDQISACNVDRVRESVITVQYAMRKRPSSKDWPEICAPPATKEEAEKREAYRAQIRQLLANPTDSPARFIPPDPEQEVALDSDDNIQVAVQASPRSPSSTRQQDFTATVAELAYRTPSSLSRAKRAAESSPRREKNTSVRAQRARRTILGPVALVPVISRRETLLAASKTTPPKLTPSKALVKRSRARPEMFDFSRPDGITIPQKKSRQLELMQPLEPIQPHLAHPPHTGLLFRYWIQQNPDDHNSEDGFVARKYFRSNVTHFNPPKSVDVDMTDVLNHMDRKMDKTPFISTCNRLVWIIRLAVRDIVERGETNGRISIINPAALDRPNRRTVFWARPFHDEMCKKRAPFSNGAMRYRGTYEFLVWGVIPKEAMVTTIKVKDLYRLVAPNPGIGQVLRLHVLEGPGSRAKQERRLRADAVPLNMVATEAMAQLANFMGLTASSPIEHISHIVADVVQGWGLLVEEHSSRQWQGLANAFVKSFPTTQNMDLREEQAVKLAFLDGVRWGMGDPNARHTRESILTMQKRARAVGLDNPAKLIADELDAIKIMVWTHENRIGRMLEARSGPKLLEDDQADDGDNDYGMMDQEPEHGYGQPKPSRPRINHLARQMMHEDEAGDSDDELTYQFDDNGFVV